MKNTIEEIAWISRIVLFDDERAFCKLLDRYHAPVRRMMMAQTCGDDALSDDLTQEVFIKVWLNIRSFSMKSRFSTWRYRIAYNVFIDYCRCRRPTERLSLVADVADEVYNDDIERLHGALAELSPPWRACMTLFYLEGMPPTQIAEITGMNEVTVRSHLSRGRKRMKELIEDERL